MHKVDSQAGPGWWRGVGYIIPLVFGLLATPLVSQAQPLAKVPHIGWVRGANCPNVYAQAFREGLHALGYVEGQHLTIEERCNKGLEEARVSSREFVRLGVDLLLAAGPEYVLRAASEATRTIPILIIALDYDPLAKGYIASLARPGGNITGLVAQQVLLTALCQTRAGTSADPGSPAPAPSDLRFAELCGGRRADVLRREVCGPIPAWRCLLCGSHPERRQARGPAGAAADDFPFGHQPQDRQGDRPEHSAAPPLAGGQSDSVARPEGRELPTDFCSGMRI